MSDPNRGYMDWFCKEDFYGSCRTAAEYNAASASAFATMVKAVELTYGIDREEYRSPGPKKNCGY